MSLMTDNNGTCYWAMQIRAGTGGDEATLWAGELLRMYQRYADNQGWKISFISESQAENGGYKEAIVQVETPLWNGGTASDHTKRVQ
jgi:protein subunit release factor A